MLRFKNYLSEEVMPTVLSNGSIDIEKESVRDELNGYLSSIATRPCITPYIALNKMRKVLAYFHVYLPKRSYMEGKHGIEVWSINQFGDKMGMNDQGEFVKSVPAKYHLFFHYHLLGSHYYVEAKIVDDSELEDKVSTTQKMFAEDASCQQTLAKAIAPKEAIKHTDDGTESTEKAVAVSQRKSDKKLSADKLDEVSLGKLVSYKNKAGEGREKGLALADKKLKGKAKVNASAPKHPYMEETLDETRMPASVIKHKQKLANMTPEEKAKKFAGKSEEQLKSMARRHGYGKDSTEYSKHVKEEQIDEISSTALKSYKSAAKADRKMSKAVVKKGLDIDGKWKHAIKKRKAGIELAKKKLDEKAPPGDKFERMVKHIKKGYSKDGLTAKEKSIAYATAWKAKNKESKD
jgi:hypothetical protein